MSQLKKGQKTRVMYIENKSVGLSGPARIGLVSFSKSGKTIYYGDRRYCTMRGSGFKSNYFDSETYEEFWISGPRKDGADRLYGEAVPIEIDENVREEYWVKIRGLPQRKRDATA